MATSSPVYGLPIPTGRETPDMPEAMTAYTTKLESVLSTELAKTLRSRGFIPDGTDVRTLGYGVWTQSSNWEPKGITNLPHDTRAKNAGTLEVMLFAGKLRMLRWTTSALNSSTKPYSWVAFQGYSGWGPWNEIAPEQAITSVAGLKGAITNTALVDALGAALTSKIEAAVSAAAIEAAEGDLDVFDARYRLEDDGTHNTVFGKDALRLRKYPEVRNNVAIGAGSLFNMEKGRYNEMYGLQAGYSLNGAGYSESEGKASRNTGVGSNTQRFNTLGMNNVTMGRNSMQCNVNGVNNTYLGAGSAQGIAHMRMSDGVIENQLPQEVWGNATVGTATHRYGLGNQNAALGAYALAEIKLGDGNVALGAAALSNLGKDEGNNGKKRVDLSTNTAYQALAFTITDGVLSFTAPLGHPFQANFMLQCKIDGFETQYWYVKDVTGQTVTLETNQPGYSYTGTMDVVEYFTNALGASPTDNIGIGRNAGIFMADGRTPANSVSNAVAIGANSTFIGDNTVALGNSQQTVHTYSAVQTRSDARDKKDVTDLVDGLDLVERLRPVSYRLAPRNGPAADERLHTGFIAQEVAAAAEGTDFEGVTEKGGAFSLAYEELVPVLVKAVQELSAEIATLRKAA